MTPYFFGYGSLVNKQTHNYPDARSAKLHGWRRAWVRTAVRDLVFLSVVEDNQCSIDGLVAAVPNNDWDALDAREAGYARLVSGGAVEHPLAPETPLAHYAVPPSQTGVAGRHHILLSYLDVVVQGFHREFGEEGVARFFDTTDGWHTPVLNDRAAPKYPRAQQLSRFETALVDDHLTRLSAFIE